MLIASKIDFGKPNEYDLVHIDWKSVYEIYTLGFFVFHIITGKSVFI